ncbi:SpoIIIAH-like family protein [uncultured Clostridium sp.]|jgi:stage III sporulation protein AH|uniref:SpoIIIAH-like family protein n=1 Tax=uncultured Clostridium sp. TaxID=59620 RepID=UPI0026067390|nr:SpoIIIAH-like family protein [uncultured Clostridium sp.]
MNNKGINSKQAMIIVTLMVLILGVGALATNVNNRLSDGDLALTMKEQTEGADKGVETTNADYFYETRSVREQEDERAIQTLKTIIADENTSKEQKDSATEKLSAKTTNRDLESRIELNIKSKGYKDAICFLDAEKARVVVSQAQALTEEQVIEIQDIVKNVSKVYDVQIEAK